MKTMRPPFRHALCAAAASLLAACDALAPMEMRIVYCEALDYRTRLVAGAGDPIDRIEVWAGNREGMADAALISIDDPARIEAITAFFLDRPDQWYEPAGDSYDPDSRRPVSEFTLKFLSGGRERSYIGWGYNYLETPGCDTEVVRVLFASDRPQLSHLVFGTPAPA